MELQITFPLVTFTSGKVPGKKISGTSLETCNVHISTVYVRQTNHDLVQSQSILCDLTITFTIPATFMQICGSQEPQLICRRFSERLGRWDVCKFTDEDCTRQFPDALYVCNVTQIKTSHKTLQIEIHPENG